MIELVFYQIAMKSQKSGTSTGDYDWGLRCLPWLDLSWTTLFWQVLPEKKNDSKLEVVIIRLYKKSKAEN